MLVDLLQRPKKAAVYIELELRLLVSSLSIPLNRTCFEAVRL